MSRLDRDAIVASLTDKIGAQPDPAGQADLVASTGTINVAAAPADIGPAIARLKPLPGYRWIAVNSADLFTASPKTIGTKVGILDPSGKVLKAADLPRRQ